jgi:hydrogenase nickel incorporation protein HypA/HybF
MHEMGIVQSIMDVVEQQAQLHGARKVVKISLEFGALTAVLPDAIRFSFEILSKGGIAEAAALDITIIPIKAVCTDCSSVHIMEDYQPFCPTCNSGALQIVEGRDEMRIASMEIEDGSDP